MVAIRELQPFAFNPRGELDAARVKQLAASIKAQGLLHPLLLRKNGSGFEVVAGNYRKAALEELHGADYELQDVEFRACSLSDEEAARLSLMENMARHELSDMELARCVKLWMEKFGKTQREVAAIFGRSQPWVSQTLALLEEMPASVREGLEDGSVSRNHWLELRKIRDAKLQEHLAEAVKSRELSVMQTREMVRKAVCRTKKKPEAFVPQTTTLWDFATCDAAFGVDYPGRLPGQVVQNLLWLFTDEGDLVVDPMAGGGTTLDVCLAMNRECHAYDLLPVREDVRQHDVTAGIPEEDESVDFLLLDPPYWKTKKYAQHEGQLAAMSLEEFLSAMEKLAAECARVLAASGHVALVMGNWMEKSTEFVDLAFECWKRFSASLRPITRICLTNRNYSGASFANTIDAKRKRYLLNGFREVMVWGKPRCG